MFGRLAAVVGLIAGLLGGPALAQTAPVLDPEAVLVEELVVNAKLPGPAWWKVSDADSWVYVLAVPAMAPKDLVFDASVIERRVEGANRLILAPEPKINPVRMVALAIGGRRYFLSERPMRETLPPALRGRLEARLRAVGEPLDALDDVKPAFAGFLLTNMRKGDSVSLSGGAVADRVQEIARAKPRKARPRIVRLEGYDLIDALKAVGSLPQAQQEACLDAGLRQAESGEPGAVAIAQRWAEGDVVTQAAADRGFQACLSAAPRVAAEIRQTIDRSAGAIEAALKVPGKSVALVHLRPLLARDGVLERLKARGFGVSTPGD